MRYLLFTLSGVFAFILPYISFPDRNSKLWQIANLSRKQLFHRYLEHHRSVLLAAGAVVLVTALADSLGITNEMVGQFVLLTYGMFFMIGIYLFSASRYLSIGRESQQWQEGVKGRKVRKRMADMAKYPMDPGSIPSLIASVVIALTGMLAVVIGAFAFSIGGVVAESAIGLLLFLWGMKSSARKRGQADRHFYETNAFFGEFFGVSSGAQASREAVKVDQLWWIPGRWKAHGWAFMTQMDRKMPAGRFIAVGHLLIWVLAYQDVGRTLLIACWALFAVAHHGLLMLTMNEAVAPKWWLRNLDSPLHWIFSRFWAQVRWVLPLAFSMLVMRWLFAVIQWEDIGFTLLIFLMAGGILSIFISFRYERKYVN